MTAASRHRHHEQGVGLIVTLVVILLFLAVTAAVLPLSVTETAVSANHRRSVMMLYAAEAGLEWVSHELGTAADWSDVLQGRVRSGLWAPVVSRQLPGGAVLDLGQVTDELNDQLLASGYATQRQWRLFLHESFDRIVPRPTPVGTLRVAVWVSDDIDEIDGDPGRDTNGSVVVRAAAFGASLGERAVEATVRRHRDGTVELLSWTVSR